MKFLTASFIRNILQILTKLIFFLLNSEPTNSDPIDISGTPEITK